MPRRLRSKALVSYIPALLLTVVAVLVVSRTFGLTLRYGDDVLQSTRLIASANALQSHIATAQSSLRGFAITGEEASLDPYREAEYELRSGEEPLHQAWASRPEEREIITQALGLFYQWRDEVAEPIIETGPLPRDETSALLMRGRPILVEANRLIRGVIETEQRILQERSDQHDSVATWGLVVAVGAPLLALLYVLLVGFYLTRRTVRTVEAVSQAAEDFAAGDLLRRVEVHTADELGAMGATFNSMAERLAERTAEVMQLVDLTQMLQVTQSTAEIGRLFETLVPRLLSIPGGYLHLLEPSDRLLVSVGGWGSFAAEPFSPSACWAIRLGKPYRSMGQDGPVCEHVAFQDDICSFCVPMVVQGEVLGLIQYFYRHDGEEESVVRIGSDVAERIAFTVSNLRLRERLREQSIRDPLTGLFNRRYLDEIFGREIERARRFGHPLGVLMIDIDHFKQLNDSEGHDAGDAVLREFGGLLASAFRTGDEAYRYGGEEFLVVMPDASSSDVLERARALQARVSRLHVAIDGRTLGPITVSMGISSFPDDGGTMAALLRAADEALYRAKEQGRNEIVMARSDPKRG